MTDVEFGGGHPPSTTLFDITTQIWPCLDTYDRLAIRQSCREGLRTHDCLLTTVSIHDLWGRVLPGAPQEIANTLRRMIKRGCAPCELVLRLRGCSTTAREARGLAVLNALTPRPCASVTRQGADGVGNSCSRSDAGGGGIGSNSRITYNDCRDCRDSGWIRSSSEGCGRDSAPSGSGTSASSSSSSSSSRSSRSSDLSNRSLTYLRLEGLPLTPRVLQALAAASRGFTRLKLYGYDLSEDGSGAVAAAATTTRRPEHWLPPPRASASALGIAVASRRFPGRKSIELSLPGTPRAAARVAAAAVVAPQHCTTARGCKDAPPATSSCNAQGAPPLLGLLAHQLQELTLQDCSIGSGNRRDGSNGGTSAGSVPTGGGGSGVGSGSANPVPGRSGGGDGNGECCKICGGGDGIPPAAVPLCAALRSCTALRHLGLRHSAAAGCPVLRLLLRPGACCCGDGGGGGASTAIAPAVAKLMATPDPGLSVPPPPPPPPGPPQAILAALTQLISLKVQTPLPTPGGPDAVGAALRQLTGLTRLELGARTAVSSAVSLLLSPQPQPPLINLRDLSLVSAQVTSTAELAALAELRGLTRLSVGALSLTVPTATAEEGPCEDAGSGSGLQDTLRSRTAHQGAARPPASALPLPPRLEEMSIAAPLPPATLLALRRPPSLRTLRLTGFTLDLHDVDDPVADAGADGSAPLSMRTSSERRLSEALAALYGRFAYRDLGIELHIGFLGPAARRLRYLAAPGGGYRPVGHWTWASRLVPLALQGLELAGLELQEGDVSALACQLWTLEDLRLDCRYPLHALVHLAALRRLRRLMLNASFWRSQSQAQGRDRDRDRLPAPLPQPLPQPQQHQQQVEEGGHVAGQVAGQEAAAPTPLGGPDTADEPLAAQSCGAQKREESDAEVAAAALTLLCGAAPECLYDVALASYGSASARFCAMQAIVWVEEKLSRVGFGALRLWVSP